MVHKPFNGFSGELAVKMESLASDEKQRLLSIVKKRRVRRVLLHFPAGFFDPQLVRELEKSCEVFVWSEPCFGACDVPFWGARELGCGLIVTFGHSALGYHKRDAITVEFVELKIDGKIDGLPLFSPKTKIGLLFTVQFIEQFREAKLLLRRKGRKVVVGGPGKMCKYPGQVTGCDVESARSIADKVDVFLLIGQEKFHAIEVSALGRPVTVFDPVTGRAESFEPHKKRNMAALVHEKQSFGILLSTKPGQKDVAGAGKLKRRLEDSGKRATIFAGDTFTGNLQNFREIEVFITTACPRMAGDAELFGRPVLTGAEALEALALLSDCPRRVKEDLNN